jgi:peptide/nickel transport system substrate-binding protein
VLPLILTLLGCGAAPELDPGVVTVLQEQQATWIRNFNPMLTTGGARWPTRSGIYEPLLIFNGATGEWTPWLAEAWAWSDDGLALTFDLRDGVQWSDGETFAADDVVATFHLLRDHPSLDLGGLWGFVESVDATDPDTVVVRFQRRYSPGLIDIAHQPIIPEHIWSEVEDPTTWANPDPVATGPFTEVNVFRSQVFELGKNPNYWQQGLPHVQALRFPAVGSNEQAAWSIVEGDIDWAGTFIPAIDRVYVGRDPDHHKYWFPQTGGMVFLYPNTTKPPLDNVDVRKALSMALDRELIVNVAMYGYTEPANPTGMSDSYSDWRDPAAEALGSEWMTYNPEGAAAALETAGWTLRDDGVRYNAAGEPLELSLSVVSGWSDWVRAAQVASRNLEAVGVRCTVQSKDFSAWFDSLGRGDFDLSIAWSEEGPTPYGLYKGLLSAKAVQPIGEPAIRNWHRYADPQADGLLAAFEDATNPALQRQAITALQMRFVTEAPALPLFPNPSWGEYSTARFVGWPSAENPYARLSPNLAPDPLLVMTQIMPRQTRVANQ